MIDHQPQPAHVQFVIIVSLGFARLLFHLTQIQSSNLEGAFRVLSIHIFLFNRKNTSRSIASSWPPSVCVFGQLCFRMWKYLIQFALNWDSLTVQPNVGWDLGLPGIPSPTPSPWIAASRRASCQGKTKRSVTLAVSSPPNNPIPSPIRTPFNAKPKPPPAPVSW